MELYIRTEEFLDQLETDFIETLQKSLGDSDFKTTLKKNISDLKPRGQYIVLVAGEMIQLLFYTVCLRIHFISISRLKFVKLYEYFKNKPEAEILKKKNVILRVEN